MCGCAEGWIFGYGDIQMCISSGIRIDGIMGRCIIIGFVVDSVVFGRRKVFHARRAEQQLERQGGRKDGSVWSFAACLCKTFACPTNRNTETNTEKNTSTDTGNYGSV